MKTTVKRISGLFMLLLLTGWAAYQLTVNSKTAEKEIKEELSPVEYTAKAVKVSEMEFPDSFTYSGTIEAGKMISIFAESDGKIIYSAIQKGVSISKGQILAKADPSVRQSDYQMSLDKYHKAKSDYSKLKELLAADNASAIEVENAKLQLQNAASQLNINKKQVARTQIVAPEDGVIITQKINQGEYVQAGSLLGTLACLNEVIVTVYIPEHQVTSLKKGTPVTLKADVYPNTVFKGKITSVIPVASAAKTFPVEIKLPNTAREKLMAGMNVSVIFNLGKTASTLVIPRTALTAHGKRAAVYVIYHSNPVLRPVVLGNEYGVLLEVLKGLQPGDTVMTSGQANVEPGKILKHIQLAQ